MGREGKRLLLLLQPPIPSHIQSSFLHQIDYHSVLLIEVALVMLLHLSSPVLECKCEQKPIPKMDCCYPAVFLAWREMAL